MISTIQLARPVTHMLATCDCKGLCQYLQDNAGLPKVCLRHVLNPFFVICELDPVLEKQQSFQNWQSSARLRQACLKLPVFNPKDHILCSIVVKVQLN